MPSNLPSVIDARMPIAYEAAREALSKCEHVDECKDWSDKAAALASYAKQAKDETLERAAMRIRARAVRRAGELLQEIEPKRGARSDLGEPSPRSSAAKVAALSPDQVKQALRVAAVPREEFEEAVEAERPATVTQLADRGKVARPKQEPFYAKEGISESDFHAATSAAGSLQRLAEFSSSTAALSVARGCLKHEVDGLKSNAVVCRDWIVRLLSQLEKRK